MKTFFSTLILLTLTIGCASSFEEVDGDETPEEKDQLNQPIVGGQPTQISVLPWQVLLTNSKGLGYCGGTLISPEWVVTAAHCLLDEDEESGETIPVNKSDVFVAAGINSILEAKDAAISVDRVILHEDYDYNAFPDDIGLLKLSRPVTLSDKIKTIALVDADAASRGVTAPGTMGVVSGWGATTKLGTGNPTTLHSVSLPIVSNGELTRTYSKEDAFAKPPKFFKNSQMGAGFIGGSDKDSCKGDSGGPFVVGLESEPLLAGVVSFGGRVKGGSRCADPNSIGVYTRVESFVPWIRQYVPSVRTSSQPRQSRFSDLRGYPAEAEIMMLSSRGVIAGYADGTFRPRATATRAEVAAVIASAFGEGATPGALPFKDMQGHWARDAVSIATQKGFISGYNDGTFRPNQLMTRQEAIVALASGLGLDPATFNVRSRVQNTLPGGSEIAPWAFDRVASAYGYGLLANIELTSSEDAIDPTQPLQRGQLASMIYNSIDNWGE